MNCPIDGTILVLAERSGIEIDHCPACRGVWLDRGEIDKLIDRAAELEARGSGRDDGRRDRDDGRRDRDDDDDRAYSDGRSRSKSKRKSFLGDLFELGG